MRLTRSLTQHFCLLLLTWACQDCPAQLSWHSCLATQYVSAHQGCIWRRHSRVQPRLRRLETWRSEIYRWSGCSGTVAQHSPCAWSQQRQSSPSHPLSLFPDTHGRWPAPLFNTGASYGLSHLTCFGQWDVSKQRGKPVGLPGGAWPREPATSLLWCMSHQQLSRAPELTLSWLQTLGCEQVLLLYIVEALGCLHEIAIDNWYRAFTKSFLNSPISSCIH